MGLLTAHVERRPRNQQIALRLFLVNGCLAALTFAAGEYELPSTRASEPQFVCRSWTSEDGLPQNSVNALLQTRDGYLWVGTFGGLARFDGLKFTVFNVGNTEGLASNRILTLLEDRSGVLWIATEDGGVSRYEDGGFTSLTEPDGLPSNAAWGLAEDHLGRVWIGTKRGLVRINQGRVRVFTSADGLPSPGALALLCDRRGRMWIGTDRGLACFEDGEFRVFTVDDGLPHEAVWSLMEDQVGNIWIGTRDGVAFYSGNRIRSVTDSWGVIWSLVQDRHGDVWVGVEQRGLVRRSGSGGFHLPRSELQVVGPGSEVKTPIPPPRSLLEDREGDVWLGTRGKGLIRLKRARVHVLGPHNGCPTGVVPIVSDGEDGVLFGSGEPGVWRWRDGEVSALKVAGLELLETNLAFTLHRDSSGGTWISHGKQVSVVRDGRFTLYTPEDGIGWGDKRAIYRDREGRVWIGSTEGLVVLDDGDFTTFTTRDGLGGDHIHCITQDREGSLWIGTFSGLTRFVDGAFNNYSSSDGLSRGAVRALYEDGDGVLWIGTYGGGLSRLKDGRFARFTSADGLFDNVVSSILEDDRGNLWMNGNRGIFMAPRRMLNDFAEGLVGRIECVSLSGDEGVSEGNGGAQAAGCRTSDGRMWFPNINGMVVLDPEEVTRPVAPPPPALEQVVVDGEPVSGRGEFELPPGVGDLEFHYTALTFRSSGKTRFKYRLDGYDENWVFAGTRRTAYYTRVPPGEYVFKVRAAHEAGAWSPKAASAGLSLAPHVYQTTWFRVGAVVAVVLLAVVLGTRRMRALRTRVATLKREIADRERAERERARLEVQLRHAQKMEAVGTLSAGIAHDFNNLITAIQGYGRFARSLIGENRQLGQAIDGITQAAGQAANVTRSLLTFSRKTKMTRSPADLIEIVDKSVAMLHPMLRTAVEVRTEIRSDGPLWIEADDNQIQQVIINLALNARDAMPDGGTLRIAVERTFAEEGNSDGATGDGRAGSALLIVEDDGVGMTEEVRRRVFDPFFSTKGRSQGTGLGMAVVHGIVRGHGGRITLKSRFGEGTRVTIELPCCPAPAPQPEERAVQQPARRGKSELILVVEENEQVRAVVAGALEAQGYRVIAAIDGAEALELFGTHQDAIRLVVVDLELPRVSGAECIRRIRALRGDMPIIAISGLGRVDLEEANVGPEKRALQDVTLLRKPFTLPEFLTRVQAQIERRSDEGSEAPVSDRAMH